MSEIIKTENGLTYAKGRNLLSNASGFVLGGSDSTSKVTIESGKVTITGSGIRTNAYAMTPAGIKLPMSVKELTEFGVPISGNIFSYQVPDGLEGLIFGFGSNGLFIDHCGTWRSGSVTLSLPDTVKGVAVVLRKQGDDEAITLNDIGENLGGVLI